MILGQFALQDLLSSDRREANGPLGRDRQPHRQDRAQPAHREREARRRRQGQAPGTISTLLMSMMNRSMNPLNISH